MTLLLLGGCAQFMGLFGGGADPMDFGGVDLDGDKQIVQSELNKWGQEQGVFDMLGGVEGVVEPLDLASGLYGLWDLEGSGITEAEWLQGIAKWFPDGEAGAFGEWDFDGDGLLDENELRAGFAHTGLADTWDTDDNGEISDKETYGAIYEVFDENGDDRLTEAEWKTGMGGWGWSF